MQRRFERVVGCWEMASFRRFFCAVFSSFVFINKTTYFYASKYTSVLGVFFLSQRWW
jgi:hypothetical protein